MAKLKDLLSEVTSQVPRRVELMRVEAILENIAPKLSEAEQKKIAEIYLDLKMMTDSLNMTPYTVFNNQHWTLLEMIVRGKVAEFKLIAEDIAEDNKDVDCWPLVKALDTILI
jgi:O6-methylguanine-DNA--protein-cysteine methyltransferase